MINVIYVIGLIITLRKYVYLSNLLLLFDCFFSYCTYLYHQLKRSRSILVWYILSRFERSGPKTPARKFPRRIPKSSELEGRPKQNGREKREDSYEY